MGNANSSGPVPTWRRAAAIGYDLLALFAIAFAATALLLLVIRQPVPAGHPLFQLYLLLAFKPYFVLGWRYGGQTLGMRSWRLYLEPARKPLGWGRAMLRYWVAVGSWLPAGLGYWWMLIDRERRTWADLVAGTRVRFVNARPLRAAATRR